MLLKPDIIAFCSIGKRKRADLNQNAAPPSKKPSAEPVSNEADVDSSVQSGQGQPKTDARPATRTGPKKNAQPKADVSAENGESPGPKQSKNGDPRTGGKSKPGLNSTEEAAAKAERRNKRRERERQASQTAAEDATPKPLVVAAKADANPVAVTKPKTPPAVMPQAEKAPSQTQKIAGPARRMPRHTLLMLSLLLWVFAPLGGAGWYLYTIAQDQYASYVGFAVRSEEVSSGIEILGGITDLSGNSSSDTDILYKFIQGRQMIQAVNETLDLRAIYNNPDDPLFALKENAPIEEIETYWRRVVKVFYDTQSGLLELRIVAFDPHDAQNVAEAIVTESTRIINELTTIARSDTTGYAEDELNRSIERLKIARQALNTFRARTQIVDPFADTQGHLGLLNNLQTQLATALIDLDLIRLTARSSDPRIQQEERRVDVIRKRISEERNRFGSDQEGQDAPDDTYSRLVGEYEVLAVDLDFASKSYLSSLAAYDSAVADAQRKSRYLAAYIRPTLAESPEYPQRALLMVLIGGGLLLSWMIFMLIYYSVRDRR